MKQTPLVVAILGILAALLEGGIHSGDPLEACAAAHGAGEGRR